MLWFSNFERWSIYVPLNLIILFAGHECVNAALNFVEACPASRALGFAVGGLARARPAPDGAVTAIVKWIVRNLVFVDVVPDLLARPIGHWVELYNVALIGGVEH